MLTFLVSFIDFVCSFYVGGKLFWGVDRLFMVERCLGKQDAAPERIMPPPKVLSQSYFMLFYQLVKLHEVWAVVYTQSFRIALCVTSCYLCCRLQILLY